MGTEEMVQIFEQHFTPYFTHVVERLADLGVPQTLISEPKRLLFVIDGRACTEKADANFDREDMPEMDFPSGHEAACYVARGQDWIIGSIRFSTHNLAVESEEVVPEPVADRAVFADELIKILFAHELVHAAMITRLATPLQREPIVNEWIDGIDLRYIHECIALRVCQTMPEMLVSARERDRYMAHCQNRAAGHARTNAYRRYFDDFRGLPDGGFWDSLVADEEINRQITQLLAIAEEQRAA